MILVRVELLPGGAPVFRRTIATIEITNVSGLAEYSDYLVEIFEDDNRIAGTKEWSRTVVVRNHARESSIWTLIAASILASSAKREP